MILCCGRNPLKKIRAWVWVCFFRVSPSRLKQAAEVQRSRGCLTGMGYPARLMGSREYYWTKPFRVPVGTITTFDRLGKAENQMIRGERTGQIEREVGIVVTKGYVVCV